MEPIKARSFVYSTTYHLAWTTKYRREVFTTDKLAQDMKDILLQTAQEKEIDIQDIEVMPDHIHVTASFSPRLSISLVMNYLKGIGSHRWGLMHPETKTILWNGSLFSHSYFVSTVGEMRKATVEKYIQDQKKK
ncbi:IS200/IS605 family transposase [Weissella confusa]|uniref:IS200/IS605 family transposase n=1 Tax=Weissella confusa TaxID=1583 RepID=UPI0022E5B972|nr:IS200/IS605 family transposase [Weissella confusa]